VNTNPVQPIQWKDNVLVLLDQRKLPQSIEYVTVRSVDDAVNAIKEMVVRGAPAIAITGLYGLVLFLQTEVYKPNYTTFTVITKYIQSSRPTAVNLKLALEMVLEKVPIDLYDSTRIDKLVEKLLQIANDYFQQDIQTNLHIQKNGTSLFHTRKKEYAIVTHCNTGALATAGIGTALGVIRGLRDRGHKLTVYADETRPYLQGSRLTAWEMMQENIDCYIITDSMAGWLFKTKKIDAVIVGADRIASNGDTANKIGTYPLAIVAKEHGVPFYVCASKTSFDFTLSTGDEIPIEMRASDELTQNSFLKDEKGDCLIEPGFFAPVGAKALNPSFDITPAKYITAIITEKGIIKEPNKASIEQVML
jgi:methylthioribose-1-phosphate isomerase